MNNQKVVEAYFDYQNGLYNKDSASNPNGSLFFENDVIYSYGYHFPIARAIKNKFTNNNTLFLTLQKYSATTGKHVSLVKYERPYYYNVISVYTIPTVDEDITIDWLYREVELSAIEFGELQSKKNNARTREHYYHEQMVSISENINEIAFSILKLEGFSELPPKFHDYKYLFNYKLFN